MAKSGLRHVRRFKFLFLTSNSILALLQFRLLHPTIYRSFRVDVTFARRACTKVDMMTRKIQHASLVAYKKFLNRQWQSRSYRPNESVTQPRTLVSSMTRIIRTWLVFRVIDLKMNLKSSSGIWLARSYLSGTPITTDIYYVSDPTHAARDTCQSVVLPVH